MKPYGCQPLTDKSCRMEEGVADVDCRTSRLMMHRYLDGDLSEDEQQELRQHFNVCSACLKHFRELDYTVTALQADAIVDAPPDFTEKLFQQLPKKTSGRRSAWGERLRRHPFIFAASIFLILMSTSFVAAWNKPTEFSMTTDPENLDAIVIDAETQSVRIPEGHTVEGDLIVRGGKVDVRGEVTGNVVAVDGEVVLASTAHIYGKKEEIDQVFDWIWFESRRLLEKLWPGGRVEGD